MERKTVLYIAMSLDGYIADAKGGVAWLGGHEKEYGGDYGYEEFIQGVDTVLMGWNTYHQVVTELSPDEWAYPGLECYVFTHRQMTNKKEVQFLSGDASQWVRRFKAQPGKKIWICGGANLIHQLMEEDLIDEYCLTIMPILLGEGTPLFSQGRSCFPLVLQHSKAENGVVEVCYTRRKPEKR